MDFDLRQLEIFRKVVEVGSFSKAAREVFLAQASVSERIATLEHAVGTRLLDRLGRKVTPTRAGELLYKHATLLLDMKRTAALEMKEFLGLKRGEVHIGGSTIPGEYIFPKVFGRFHEKYPFIAVNLTIADSREVERQVLAGDLELGVIGSRSTSKDLVCRALWQDTLVLAVPAGHRWAQEKDISLAQLAEEPFIFRESGSGTLKAVEDHLRESRSQGIDSFKLIARFGTSTAVKEGIKAGLGVSILSSRAIATDLKAGAIAALTVRGLPMARDFFLIRDRRRIASPLCTALSDFLMSTGTVQDTQHSS